MVKLGQTVSTQVTQTNNDGNLYADTPNNYVLHALREDLELSINHAQERGLNTKRARSKWVDTATKLLTEHFRDNKLISDLKSRIATAQIKADLSVNKDLILLYWEIGQELLERQKAAQWGDKVLERLSKDLSSTFPEMKGFSKTNLKYEALRRKLSCNWSTAC